MKTVLIADDGQDIRRLYLRELEKEGYHVLLASNGQEAVQQVRENSPQLVVMDIHMSEVDGVSGMEAMNRILEENNELPIIINTACNSYKDSFRSWSAEAYLTKSSDLAELKETIHVLLDGDKKKVQPAQRHIEKISV